MENKHPSILTVFRLVFVLAVCTFALTSCNYYARSIMTINRNGVIDAVNTSKDDIPACIEEMRDFMKELGIKSANFKRRGLFERSVIAYYYEKGEMITKVTNKTIENLFSSMHGLRNVAISTDDSDSVEFYFITAYSYYCGFCYVPGDRVEAASFYHADGEWEKEGEGWSWKEKDGDNRVYYERICENFYLFEQWF